MFAPIVVHPHGKNLHEADHPYVADLHGKNFREAGHTHTHVDGLA